MTKQEMAVTVTPGDHTAHTLAVSLLAGTEDHHLTTLQHQSTCEALGALCASHPEEDPPLHGEACGTDTPTTLMLCPSPAGPAAAALMPASGWRGDSAPEALTWVVLDEGLVQVGQLVRGDVPAGVIWRLEVQVILPRPEELGGGYVHANDNLIGVAGFPNGVLEQLQGWKDSGDKYGHRAGRDSFLAAAK